METITITLVYHDELGDWTLEVGGILRHHISIKTVDEIVEYAVVAIQEALLSKQEPLVSSLIGRVQLVH